MKWEQGCQGTGYKKHRFFQIGNKTFGGADLYLLKYEKGDSIPVHTDPVTGKRHFRFNLELKSAKVGGKLYIKNPILKFGPFSFFRSDLSEHAVQLVEEGTRYVLSFGVAI
jgi:hypothetical protein